MRVAGIAYTLRRHVDDDTIEVCRGNSPVGSFHHVADESGERLRHAALASSDDAFALRAIARAWLEREAARARTLWSASASEDELPSTSQPDDDTRPPTHRKSGPRVRGAAVLVVEPDVAFRKFIAFALQRRGYAVECAESGKEARAFVSSSFAVVVCNADLADETSGVAILTLFRLRSRARTILLSPIPARGEHGAVDVHVVVPCHVVAIIQAVERLVPASSSGGSAPASSP
ncbi:MAG: hypothetical protein JWM74_2706 [Myxococcaceae bacterium]|nr:hypothetical protein [Myxococcaceae bacterium]